MGWIDGLLGGFGSLIGSGINAGLQSQINKQNADLQKEFAQNSLQWKVQDAKKAGIAPEIALGAQGYSASPSYVGSDSGGGVSSAFKHFGSAIDNYINDEEDKRQLELEGLRLDNEAKRKKLQGSDPFGGFVGTPMVQVGLPPTSNDPKEAIYNLDKALKAETGYSVTSTLDGKGIRIGYDPNSIDGQQSAEIGLDFGLINTARINYDVYKSIPRLEKEARKRGLLKKDEEFEFVPSRNGVELYPVKKSRPTYKQKVDKIFNKYGGNPYNNSTFFKR